MSRSLAFCWSISSRRSWASCFCASSSCKLLVSRSRSFCSSYGRSGTNLKLVTTGPSRIIQHKNVKEIPVKPPRAHAPDPGPPSAIRAASSPRSAQRKPTTHSLTCTSLAFCRMASSFSLMSCSSEYFSLDGCRKSFHENTEQVNHCCGTKPSTLASLVPACGISIWGGRSLRTSCVVWLWVECVPSLAQCRAAEVMRLLGGRPLRVLLWEGSLVSGHGMYHCTERGLGPGLPLAFCLTL
jgi:hypothetical protein